MVKNSNQIEVIFFDIESFLSFNEKNGLFDNIIKKKDPIIAIIGLIHNEKYKDSMLVATAYLSVATKILRSVMNEENYRMFMDRISEEYVLPFKKPN